MDVDALLKEAVENRKAAADRGDTAEFTRWRAREEALREFRRRRPPPPTCPPGQEPHFYPNDDAGSWRCEPVNAKATPGK